MDNRRAAMPVGLATDSNPQFPQDRGNPDAKDGSTARSAVIPPLAIDAGNAYIPLNFNPFATEDSVMNTATSAAIVAPPPAIRGLISGAFLAGILAAFVLTAAPAAAQTLTISATPDRDPNTPGVQVDEGDTVTITLAATGASSGILTTSITAFGGGATAGDDYETTAGGTDDRFNARFLQASQGFSEIQTLAITADSTPEPDEDITIDSLMVVVDTIGITARTGFPLRITIRANDDYVDPTADNPTARGERLDAPAAAVGRGVGMLAAEAVAKRAGSVVTANQLNIGRATTAEELLRRSGFNLTGNGGGRGFNFWGSGGYVSAEGDHDGVDYDGDTSAFTVGIDTNWRDGLVGVAVSRSDGDTDFTVKADGTEHTLETEVTGFHPYLTRRLNRSQLWLTAGFGSGDAEVKEPDNVVIKTDITVTTAAFGITQTRGDLFTGNLSALYTRAELDEAVGDNKTLNATTADSIRLTADADIGWTLGALRPFITFAMRHDSGDGDTGGAADLGGGVEWRTPTVYIRLAGSGHIQGQGADEQRATLTVRKSTGDFDLSINLAADGSDIHTARLLHGEWRF